MTKRKTVQRARLSKADEVFVAEYVLHHNGTRAYLAAHPHVADNTAATEAWKLLRKPKVSAAIETQHRERCERLRMDADEALALISRDARADLRRLYDADGRLLDVKDWPDDIALSVKSIEPKEYGLKVVLNDTLKARELMAIAGGKLKQVVEHQVKLEDIVAGEEPAK